MKSNKVKESEKANEWFLNNHKNLIKHNRNGLKLTFEEQQRLELVRERFERDILRRLQSGRKPKITEQQLSEIKEQLDYDPNKRSKYKPKDSNLKLKDIAEANNINYRTLSRLLYEHDHKVKYEPDLFTKSIEEVNQVFEFLQNSKSFTKEVRQNFDDLVLYMTKLEVDRQTRLNASQISSTNRWNKTKKK